MDYPHASDELLPIQSFLIHGRRLCLYQHINMPLTNQYCMYWLDEKLPMHYCTSEEVVFNALHALLEPEVKVEEEKKPEEPAPKPYGTDQWSEVESSNVAAIGLKGDSLVVKFKNGGAYLYPFAREHYFRMLTVKSVGRYVQQHVRRLQYERI